MIKSANPRYCYGHTRYVAECKNCQCYSRTSSRLSRLGDPEKYQAKDRVREKPRFPYVIWRGNLNA